MKRQDVILGLYRISVAALAINSAIDLHSLKDNFEALVLFKLSLIILYAIVFSALKKKKRTTLIEWAIILGISIIFEGNPYLLLFLLVPTLHLARFNLNIIEKTLVPLSLTAAMLFMGGPIITAIIPAVVVSLAIAITGDNVKKSDSLEMSMFELRKKLSQYANINSRIQSELDLTSKLYFQKNKLDDTTKVSTLVEDLVDSASKLFSAEYVVFYLYRQGNYVKQYETPVDSKHREPRVKNKETGEKVVNEKEIISMPIYFQRRPWGSISIIGKRAHLGRKKILTNVPFVSNDYQLLSMLMDSVLNKMREIKMKENLSRAAFYDRLTGLPNRANIESVVFENELKLSEKSGKNIYSIMFDIDDFKSYNDTYGHNAGDDVLRYVANIMRKMSDDNGRKDNIGRWGGEEFLGYFTGTEKESIKFADDIRSGIENFEFENRKITVSVGVAKYDKSLSLTDLTNRADIALYKSKSRGKNQVTLFKGDTMKDDKK